MRRRAFVLGGATLLGTASVADAQQPGRIWRIGYLDGSSPAARMALLSAFKERLGELGYATNQYVIDARFAEGYDERLPELAADLVRAKPDIIFAVGPPPSAAAARATKAIPIIFVGVGDPVGSGLVPNLAHPPANITGITLLAVELAPKRLAILKEAVPTAVRVSVIWNPANAVNARELAEAKNAAGALGVTLVPVEIRSPDDLEEGLNAAIRNRVDAIFVLSSPVTFLNRPKLTGFALKNRLPTVCALREYAQAGCLVSYGPSYADHFRRAAGYVDKILKGLRPTDLPVEQPSTFELVVNANTARLLGVSVPPSLLVRADQILE